MGSWILKISLRDYTPSVVVNKEGGGGAALSERSATAGPASVLLPTPSSNERLRLRRPEF